MADLRNVFDLGARAMAAQMVRMNTVASNLANMGTVAGSADQAFRALRPVFETEYAGAGGAGLATARVVDVVALDRAPERLFQPDNPEADGQGFVYRAAVNPDEEMVEMLEASRQYQNMVEVTPTLRSLMARTVAMGTQGG